LHFPNEKAEADWYHTPEGQAHLRKTARFKGFRNVPPTKAELQALLEQAEQARAALLKPVGIRLPQGYIDRAKRYAEKTGQGYQTILKDIIGEGLDRLGA
jgi:hypothetical protein